MAARKKTSRKRTRKRASKAKPKPRTKRGAAELKRARARRGKARAAGARERASASARPVRRRAPEGSRALRGGPRTAALASSPDAPASGPAPPASAPGTPERAFTASLAVLASEPVRAGIVRRAFPRTGVALVALEAPLAVGDRVHVRGALSDFLAEVASLRVGGVPVARVESGDATLALPTRARVGDVVYALRAPV